MQIPSLLAAEVSDFSDKMQQWLSILPEGVAKWLTVLIVFIVGRIIIKCVVKLVRRGLDKTEIDNKLAAKLGGDGTGIESLLCMIIYSVLMLFLLTITLQVAGLGDVTQPITDLLTSITGYFDNIVGAGIVIFIGFLIAKIVRQLVEGVLKSARLDERLNSTGDSSITGVIGVVVFSLIILFMLPVALGILGIDAISEPVGGIVESIIGIIPNIMIAGVLLVVGILVASIVRDLIVNLLNGFKINELPAKIGMDVPASGSNSLTNVIGFVVKLSIIVIFACAALANLNLAVVSDIADGFYTGYFNLLLAVLILGAGILLGRYAFKSLADKNLVLAKIAKVAIIVICAMAALERSNIVDPAFIAQPYQYFLIAVCGALLIGGGVALGLGGKDYVADKLSKR